MAGSIERRMNLWLSLLEIRSHLIEEIGEEEEEEEEEETGKDIKSNQKE